MQKLDELAVENGLPIEKMMERAGKHMLSVLKLRAILPPKTVCIVIGKGNKGGDGLSAAWHLLQNGYLVRIILAEPKEELAVDARRRFDMLESLKFESMLYEEDVEKACRWIMHANVIIDALIGYRLSGNPRDQYAALIKCINDAEDSEVITYDIPTGLEPTTGACLSPCVRAQATLTLALPKLGLVKKDGPDFSGKVIVADLGIPSSTYDLLRPGSRPQFSNTGLLEL